MVSYNAKQSDHVHLLDEFSSKLFEVVFGGRGEEDKKKSGKEREEENPTSEVYRNRSSPSKNILEEREKTSLSWKKVRESERKNDTQPEKKTNKRKI